MIVKKLSLQNYRNIEQAEIGFSPSLNLLYGNNAEGKTNALEAIYYFARGKSFRTSRDSDLIAFGKDFFKSELVFQDKEREKTFSAKIGKGVRERRKNGIPFSRIGDMIGEFRAVLFCPEHLSLIKGGPEERRSFLNIALSQLDPIYLKEYTVYSHILEERNRLLKMGQKGFPIDKEELLIWSRQLAERASRLYLLRSRYIASLEDFSKDILKEISEQKENLSLFYLSDVKEGEDPLSSYERALTENLEKELSAGVTLYGVHRDDMDIKINGFSSRSFASQGQQRSLCLTLKTAEGEVSKKRTGEYPVFLFDDVLSELDERRQRYILENRQDKQLILTSCYDGFSFQGEGTEKIYVEGGSYVSAYRERGERS